MRLVYVLAFLTIVCWPQDRVMRRPLPAGASFLPSDVSGLKCWLKADAIGGLSDGDAITTWEDSSADNNDATQSTAGNKPTYQTGEINSLPIVRFDGSDDYFSLPNFASGFTAGEIFIVIKIDADPPAAEGQTGLWTFNTVAAGQATHFPYTDGNIYDSFGSTARKSTGNPATSFSSAYRLYNVSTASGAWTSRIDGTQHFTTATNTVGFPTSLRFGQSDGDVADYYLDGDVAEIVIYNVVISSGDRSSLQTYFDNKYNLSY